jgi:hypothetical protein
VNRLKKNTPNNDNLKLAGRDYQVEDYKRDDQLSSGLATSHEQVSDSYMMGEVDSLIGDVNGKNISIVPEELKDK